jgi:DNA-binding XRE family transcriptional regulator
MTNKKKLDRVEPSLDELLPTPELHVAFEEASAAFEAGQLVRALREKAGLTQNALAERLNMSQPRVSAIEAGRGRDGPSYALLKRIVIACDAAWTIPSILEHTISTSAMQKTKKMTLG